MADGNITVEVTTQAAQAELERLRAENAALKRDLQYARDGLTKGRTRMREDIERLTAENAALKREAHTWSKAAETYAASEAKLSEARLAELRYVAEAAKTMLNQMAGPARADALYELREWAANRQRADVLNEGPKDAIA